LTDSAIQSQWLTVQYTEKKTKFMTVHRTKRQWRYEDEPWRWWCIKLQYACRCKCRQNDQCKPHRTFVHWHLRQKNIKCMMCTY